MGQYFYVVNLDKKECLNAHSFGDGLKLFEIACSSCGTMTALALLTCTDTERGIGTWLGDRIAIVGDYSDQWDEVQTYTDISYDIIRKMCEDPYLCRQMTARKQQWNLGDEPADLRRLWGLQVKES